MEERDPTLEAEIRQHVGDSAPIYAFRKLDSTMNAAFDLAAQGAAEGALVFALRQSKGRGRLGRIWSSPEGGIYCSLILRPRRPISEIPQLSLIAGLAAAEAIHQMTSLSPTIRWPNDLLLDGKKVAGMLVEAHTQPETGDRGQETGDQNRSQVSRLMSQIFAVVIGIGINVTTDPKELPGAATSLAAAGASCNAFELTGRLYGRFRAWYDHWTAEGFAPIRQALRAWMGLVGELVRLTVGQADIEGIATDLDESGRLLVRLDSGLVRAFEAGEVTLLR